jgi:hypothetical protein
LLDRLRLLDDGSRLTGQYQDPRYLPFYYYLSKHTSPRSLLHVGLDLALPSCCFLLGCDSVERFLGFQMEKKSFYSPRIALSNLRDTRRSLPMEYHYGKIIDRDMESKMSSGFDMVLITSKMNDDEMNEVLEVCWNHMNLDGVMVVDHAVSIPRVGDLFGAFCRSRNRPVVSFDTRYGNALTQK